MPIDETHPSTNVPKENISLWRYMDISAFLSLLSASALPFIHSRVLEDKFEGTFPKLSAEAVDERISKEIESGKTLPEYRNYSEIINYNNDSTFLNCWCKENYQMVHMWKIYSKDHGIAIETDYQRLKKSLKTEETIYPSEVRYVNFKNESIDWDDNLLTLFSIKRIEYKSENEFRLLLSFPKIFEDRLLETEWEKRSAARKQLYKTNPVIYCKVDLRTLISSIHLSPYAPTWYQWFLNDIIKKYGLELKVSRSDL